MAKLRNKGVPTRYTKGSIGDVYIDENTGQSYRCVGSYSCAVFGELHSDYTWQKMEGVVDKIEKAEPVSVKPIENEASAVSEDTFRIAKELAPIIDDAVDEHYKSKNGKTNYRAYGSNGNNKRK